MSVELGRRTTRSGERRVVGNVIRGSIGNLIEWYDWYAYTAFSVYFANAFFPKGDETAQLLNTAAVFAVGFLMRPIGGWLLGRYADRFGRRAALTLSVTLMAVGSLVIAATPSYASIGVAAPILLVLARLGQGLSVGGEYSTSATYLSEVASPGRRGFYSSFQYVTLTAGQLLALAVQIVLQQVLTSQQMHEWGWRIAFVIGAFGAVVVMLLRRKMDESASYEQATQGEKAAGDRGTLAALLRHPKEVALVAGLTLGGTVAFYTYTTYLQKFMINTSGISKETVSWINFFALLVFVVLQPLAGALSDRIGRRPLLLTFGIAGTVLTIPLLTVLSGTRDPLVAFLLMLGGLVIVTGYTSINAVVKAELFPTRIRALGVGLPYALTVAIFGGTAEYVALWLKDAGHESWFYLYVSACVLVSLIVYFCMRETSKESALEKDAQRAGETSEADARS
ncbi:MFS transporter, MHS family, alpha-ketoglutarate permease [Streptoalloteichus tenebrarius]|uniref:MFS transporter, MHS family, alpha-ketoglutarate permease n=1 Tax=Streptoalloteichus tenebrarius (strain ATCC 17920 / DSM 40477 / JCM 4838 / CBS 697.72 / NBRC 16177 / NCIMB 11028 / NRRL B-12390 / A12253. 1 / ISP 5477) TaxID=1933 RepID=A0ABT1HQW5_STRSD|nr:MFS transporter [Streptoalloteichus tenebrarius]MCP2257911.1 MFS transporter, MHS family, alpha-ketoglutarate permease [Streptoalloteichus tenebrarius]BFE99724.1 MFS transporter [Streptoalloteichus tenebrarius]